MIYAKILLGAFIVLFLIYAILTIGQLFGIWKYTTKEITPGKLFIPFYYWFTL